MQILGQMKNYEFQCLVDCYLDDATRASPAACTRFSIDAISITHTSRRGTISFNTKDNERMAK